MSLTRRRFLGQAAPLGLLPLLDSCNVEGDALLSPCCNGEPFQHGVASGDPLQDAVILWTRVTPRAGNEADIEVSWRIAEDEEMTRVVASGVLAARADADFTVKVDVAGLTPNTTYYYDFSASEQRSPRGRTRTLASAGVERARLAVVSCANYPAGFFNVYRLMAERSDIDFVVHLGDYLYEYANGDLGDGVPLDRVPVPDRELLTLDEYRQRHAQYKSDPDLQAVHREHVFIVTWDDHEVSNNAYRDGAANHQSDSEGEWSARKAAAMQAYFEWMPIRSARSGESERVYRAFAFGDLFDLIVLDTRFAGRDARVTGNCDIEGISNPERSLLGADQEAWFFDELVSSSARGARWRLVAQQVMMSQRGDASEGCIPSPDQWDGYAESRQRVFGLLRDEAIDNVLILTGDAHSSWAFDLTEDPFNPELYDPETGTGSRAVELVTPGVTSPGPGGAPEEFANALPHLKFVDLTRQGYILLDIDTSRARAHWYFADTVRERGGAEELGATFEVVAGENRWRAVPAG